MVKALDIAGALTIVPLQESTLALEDWSGSGRECKALHEKEIVSACCGDGFTSPSLLLIRARVSRTHDAPHDAMRIAANCPQTDIDAPQMLRFVGCFLLSVNLGNEPD